MQILYCDTCGVRVSEADLDRGAAAREGSRIVCPACRPQQVPVAEGGRGRSRSKIIPVSSNRRRSSESSIRPVRRETPGAPTPRPLPGHPERPVASRKSMGILFAALGLGLAGVAFLILSANRFTPPAHHPRREPERAALAEGDTSPPPPDARAPSIAAVEPGPESRPLEPSMSPAERAYAELTAFEGLAEIDYAARIGRVEAFVAAHPDSVATARARELLARLKEAQARTQPPVAVAETPPASPEPPAPQPAADPEPPTPQADKSEAPPTVAENPAPQPAAADLDALWDKQPGAAELDARKRNLHAERERLGFFETLQEAWNLSRRRKTDEALERLKQAEAKASPRFAAEFAGERDTLAQARALRAKAVLALAPRKGQVVELFGGSGRLKGALTRADEKDGLTLRLAEGPELTLAPEQLDARDLEKLVAPPDPATLEACRAYAALNALDGHYPRAFEWLEAQARVEPEADPKAARERLLLLDEKGAGLAFLRAWLAADQALVEGRFEEAQRAFQALERGEFARELRELFAARLQGRLARLERILTPYANGLWGVYGRKDDGVTVLERVDSKVDFDWGVNAPDPLVPAEMFTIVWTGFLSVPEDGHYTLALISDDGSRLFIDGKLVVDHYRPHSAIRLAGAVDLKAGLYPLKLEYFENTADASCKLLWAKQDSFAETVVPAEALWHDPTARKAEPPPPSTPAPPKPKLPEGAEVWLGDLAEQNPTVGYGVLGKKGSMGFDDLRIKIGGKESPHGLGMHPGPGTPAEVTYELEGAFRGLVGEVAINDSVRRTESAVTFKVFGDGNLLWTSKEQFYPGKPQAFAVNVTGVKALKLVVEARGSYGQAHAAWVEPKLVR
ncbi:MAG: NPCBM/NEW2 domain-containing protein [Planctomycetota bacterium]|nr:NPCBM/NEW2 domain-containing protein [Planctomycetota bacterium]